MTMRNPFTPPSMYQNYQPPPQGSDLLMPVPGWGWPAASAGPRRVGMGDSTSSGSSYLLAAVAVFSLVGGVYAARLAR